MDKKLESSDIENPSAPTHHVQRNIRIPLWSRLLVLLAAVISVSFTIIFFESRSKYDPQQFILTPEVSHVGGPPTSIIIQNRSSSSTPMKFVDCAVISGGKEIAKLRVENFILQPHELRTVEYSPELDRKDFPNVENGTKGVSEYQVRIKACDANDICEESELQRTIW